VIGRCFASREEGPVTEGTSNIRIAPFTILDEGYFGCRNTYAANPAVLVRDSGMASGASRFSCDQTWVRFRSGCAVRPMGE